MYLVDAIIGLNRIDVNKLMINGEEDNFLRNVSSNPSSVKNYYIYSINNNTQQ